MADFIVPVSNNYDEDLVRQTLWPIDAQHALAIPHPQYDMHDFVVWSYTKNRLFSVRSAYFVEWDHQHEMKPRCANGMDDKPL